MTESLPDVVRDVGTGLVATGEGETFVYAFDDTVEVPSRFDDPDAATARWRLDGTLTVRVRSLGE